MSEVQKAYNEIRAAHIRDEARLYNAEVIRDMMLSLVDVECPHCQEQLEIPSLEDIQEWLKEEK